MAETKNYTPPLHKTVHSEYNRTKKSGCSNFIVKSICFQDTPLCPNFKSFSWQNKFESNKGKLAPLNSASVGQFLNYLPVTYTNSCFVLILWYILAYGTLKCWN